MKSVWRLCQSRVILSVFLLSFSSGLPLCLVGSTLQAWYTEAGVSLMGIGLLSLVGQPYAFKWLWAPVMDRYVFFSAWGRRRAWVILMQLALVVGLLAMALVRPGNHPLGLAMLALVVAFFAASQDVAIDAYRADILTGDAQGPGASVTNLGYRLAMLVSGAIGLIIAASMGFPALYSMMAGLMLLAVYVTVRAPRPHIAYRQPAGFHETVVLPFSSFFKRAHVVWIVAFLVLYKLCDAFALSLSTPFLIRGLGFSLLDIGSITKVMGLLGALLGSIVGGLCLPRWGLYRALMYFGVLQAVSNLLFVLLAWVGKHYLLMAASIFIDYFCSGLSSIAITVLLMQLCDHRYTATQYALFSALTALGRIFVGPAAAVVATHWGWLYFYVVSFVLGFPALLILAMLKRRVFTSDCSALLTPDVGEPE